MEELENLEETLNESILESLGARTGMTSRGKKKAPEEEEEISRYIICRSSIVLTNFIVW